MRRHLDRPTGQLGRPTPWRCAGRAGRLHLDNSAGRGFRVLAEAACLLASLPACLPAGRRVSPWTLRLPLLQPREQEPTRRPPPRSVGVAASHGVCYSGLKNDACSLSRRPLSGGTGLPSSAILKELIKHGPGEHSTEWVRADPI